MATRPVFVAEINTSLFSVYNAEFIWAGGFALSQKQKNIASIHECFTRRYPSKKVLEVSSKSTDSIGISASAFNLKKYVPSLNRSIPLENVFQGSKVFRSGGPFIDLFEKQPIEAKRDERLKSSGSPVKFHFEGVDYPLIPQTIFYDFIYINALKENPEIANEILKYDGFTDIAFNPEKSINCQARSAAIFVSLSRQGILDRTDNFESFLSLFLRKNTSKAATSHEHNMPAPITSTAPVETKPDIKEGDMIIHRVFGEGCVVSVSSCIKIVFESVGEKTLGLDWTIQNCEIKHKEK